VGTGTRGDAGSNGRCTYSASVGSGVSDDGVESTLEDEAHTLGHVTPMRAQQPHVTVMSPVKAHRVSTSTIVKHGGRLRIESARRSIPCRETREGHNLQEETPPPARDISIASPYTDHTALVSTTQGIAIGESTTLPCL